MNRRLALRLVFALGLTLLAGCSTIEAPMPAAGRLDGKTRFFVHANLNDNHAISHHIVSALKLRGNEAETGPLTMMPDNTQIVIGYEDQWAWDFGDHLAYMQITARDRRSAQPLAVVRFSSRVPSRKSTADIVGELIDRLLANRKP